MIDKYKTYRTRRGQAVRIYAIDAGGEYPVHGAIWDEEELRWRSETWREDGIYRSKEYPLHNDLVEYNPLHDLTVDDRIMVRDYDGQEWVAAHFASVTELGNLLAFPNGTTSWTCDHSDLVLWQQWRLPE